MNICIISSRDRLHSNTTILSYICRPNIIYIFENNKKNINKERQKYYNNNNNNKKI